MALAMWAGGTKVEFGCEIASRGDLAAWGVGGLVLEADLARREVRLRVGAMLEGCCVGGVECCTVYWKY